MPDNDAGARWEPVPVGERIDSPDPHTRMGSIVAGNPHLTDWLFVNDRAGDTLESMPLPADVRLCRRVPGAQQPSIPAERVPWGALIRFCMDAHDTMHGNRDYQWVNGWIADHAPQDVHREEVARWHALKEISK